MRIWGPTKAALWLVESGLQVVAVVSDVAVSQRDAWASGLHTGNGRYTVRLGHIWRIYSRPVEFCGSTAGQLDVADPLFYRCLFADLLMIDCGPGRRSIWRIYCIPVVFCGSTAGQLDLAEPLFRRWLFADLLRIDGGPVYRSGWCTVGPLDFEVPRKETHINSGLVRCNGPAVDPAVNHQRNTNKQWARKGQRARSRSAVLCIILLLVWVTPLLDAYSLSTRITRRSRNIMWAEPNGWWARL